MQKTQIHRGDDLLKTVEAADYLRISKSWLDQGRIRGFGPPFHRMEGVIRYRRADLDAYQFNNRVSVS